jgi:hypothetical protein
LRGPATNDTCNCHEERHDCGPSPFLIVDSRTARLRPCFDCCGEGGIRPLDRRFFQQLADFTARTAVITGNAVAHCPILSDGARGTPHSTGLPDDNRPAPRSCESAAELVVPPRCEGSESGTRWRDLPDQVFD